jgi:EAL domain-containing protein (putative c-di-GMP-specific phosphodiesterase class I)
VDYVQGYAIDRPMPIDDYFTPAGPRATAAIAAASLSRP